MLMLRMGGPVDQLDARDDANDHDTPRVTKFVLPRPLHRTISADPVG